MVTEKHYPWVRWRILVLPILAFASLSCLASRKVDSVLLYLFFVVSFAHLDYKPVIGITLLPCCELCSYGWRSRSAMLVHVCFCSCVRICVIRGSSLSSHLASYARFLYWHCVAGLLALPRRGELRSSARNKMSRMFSVFAPTFRVVDWVRWWILFPGEGWLCSTTALVEFLCEPFVSSRRVGPAEDSVESQ